MLDVVVDDVVELDDDGAAVELVVAVSVVVAAVLVSAGVLAVVDAVVDAVVELDEVVVEPQAASAARALAAAKLRIKRMLSSSRTWDKEASALNLSDALAQSDKLESDPGVGRSASCRRPQRQFAVATEGSIPLSGGRNKKRMMEAETAALFHRAAEHMAERIDQAAIVELPSPYIFVEQMWPPALAAEILRNMYASEPSFSEQVHKGDPKNFFGSYRERIELHLPAGAAKLEPHLADFWKRLHAVTESEILFTAIFNKFRSGFDERYGSDWSAAEIHGMLRRGLLLTMHGPGYYLGPHTDRFEKVITCVFNFAEHDGLDDIGTAMYMPKEKGFTSDGEAHHDPALFDKIGVAPFRPNSGLIFFREDRTFHGVEKVTAESLGDSKRPNIQLNFWAQ